jgi:hypothetical protein
MLFRRVHVLLQPLTRRPVALLLCLLAVWLAGCGAAAVPIVPTDIPTLTPSLTPSPSRTPGQDATPTVSPTPPPMTATGGPSPTPLFGPTRVSAAATATRPPNPNAPQIELFTADVLAVAPGGNLTLFWSTRNANSATIYRLEVDGSRSQLWNVPPDGSLVVSTRRSDRDRVDFVLTVGESTQRTEQMLTLPLSCPDVWFFGNGPEACPQGPAIETRIVEQNFERGRMIYLEATARVYALFNDNLSPAWVAFDNRFDPARDPESEESFVPPPGYLQPLRQLGFVWRGNDIVRNRLGLAISPDASYDGFAQIALVSGSAENLYVSSSDGSVLQLVPAGDAWQIITPP